MAPWWVTPQPWHANGLGKASSLPKSGQDSSPHKACAHSLLITTFKLERKFLYINKDFERL